VAREPGSPEEPEAEQRPASEGPERRPTGLEGVFQEVVRRAAALGFSSFFLTEEAVRKALSEKVPQEWLDYLERQSSDIRTELADRLVDEFGSWLRELDPQEMQRSLIRTLLEEYELTLEISVSGRPRSSESAPSLQVLRRRK
jgi:hypothetical protein